MANQRRLDKKVLLEDRDAYAALQAIAGYAPNNAQFSLANVTAAHAAMNAKQTDEVQKQAALGAARDDAHAAERVFHDAMLGVKTQIAAQFGGDSNEYQALGLKKKSERKSPGRRTKKDKS